MPRRYRRHVPKCRLIALGPLLLLTWQIAQGQPESFGQCLDGLRAQARAAGLSEETVRTGLASVDYQPRVIELDRRQPEFVHTFGQYFNARVNDRMVKTGRILLDRHRPLLRRVHREFGVRPEYLVALWGLETHFGNHTGTMPVIDSLATLACDPRRSQFFTRELIEALRILENRTIERDQMIGSWAGAMGQMQFMPSTYTHYAIDYNNSGEPDLWHSLGDVFASSAHYLASVGWQRGQRWGREVRLPEGFRYELAGLQTKKTIEDWQRLGVRTAHNRPLPQARMQGSILLPAGAEGPAFLVYRNFRALMRWNTSTFYALSAGHLADRIVGLPPLRAKPSSESRGLLRGELREIQSRLNALGLNAGEPDGIAGPQTEGAIRRYQTARGRLADGYPDRRLLQALRRDGESTGSQ